MLSDVGPSVCSVDSAISERTGQDPSSFLSIFSPRDKPWDKHRLISEQVSEVFADGLPHHQRQAERMRSCSERLEFGWVVTSVDTGELAFKLKQARFCRVRTCPVCQWRRSLMWVARVYHAFPRIYADYPDLRYIMLTLTVQNCRVLDLRSTVRDMNSAWKRLSERKSWPALGFVRSLEITRSKDGLAHPHFHCLLAVKPGYFSGRDYLSQRKWASLWQEALRIDYTPIIDVRTVKPKANLKLRRESPLGEHEVRLDEVRNAILRESDSGFSAGYDPLNNALQATKAEMILSAVSEVIKYTLKPDDMLADPGWLRELSDQLRNSRAVALGGIFRQYLSEDEPENLVSEDEESVNANPGGVHFGWREDPRFARYKRKAVGGGS